VLHIEAIGLPRRCREHRRSPVTDSRADRRGHDRPDAADAWPTAGLIVTVSFDEEFIEELIDVEYTDSQSTIELGLSGDAWTLVAILIEPHRFGVRTVEPRHNDSYAVSMSTQKLRNVARESVDKGGFRHIGPDPDEPPPLYGRNSNRDHADRRRGDAGVTSRAAVLRRGGRH